MQLTYPGTRISTLQEVFDFVECADPSHQIQWNIESKINAMYPNQTKGVNEFVTKQHALFSASPYKSSITVRAPLAVASSWLTYPFAVPKLRLAHYYRDEGATSPSKGYVETDGVYLAT